MTDATCKTCPWLHERHHPQEGYPGGIGYVRSYTERRCHRTIPPWPVVQLDDWCGEHPERKREADLRKRAGADG